MKVRTIWFEDIASRRLGDIYDLCPRDSSLVPPGFVLNGGERKLIVVLCPHQLVVALGPKIDSCNYTHVEIFGALDQNLTCCESRAIAGGGSAKFTLKSGGRCFSEFGGTSGTFGVYTCELMRRPVRNAIEAEMCVVLTYNWVG